MSFSDLISSPARLLQLALFHSFFFFLWQSNIPHLLYPFLDGHLSCFHYLAIVNSPAWTLGSMCIFELCFSQAICPQVGLLDHMLVLFLVFKEISILFSIVVVQFTFPPIGYKGSFFPGVKFDMWRYFIHADKLEKDLITEFIWKLFVFCQLCYMVLPVLLL